MGMKKFLFGICFTIFYFIAVGKVSQALELQAKQALLIDLTTDTILYEKNADELMTPSSMSKMMLVYDIFSRLKDGRLSLKDTFHVSTKAWRKGGSRMFLEPGTKVTLDDLLKGIIIQSGNDASIVVAEGIAGTEEAYAAHLTEKAHELGAKTASFKNATGWPEPEHKMSARDLAVIAQRTIEDFPEEYKLYAQKSFTYNKIKQGNRNPLLYDHAIKADGVKTGSSEEGGFGLVGSVKQDGRRLLFVINGCASSKERAQDARVLVRWGIREFTEVIPVKAGEEIGKVEVINGKKRFLDIMAKQDLKVTIPIQYKNSVKLIVDAKPVEAPIVIGQTIGTASLVNAKGKVFKSWMLYADEDISKMGFFGRVWQKIMRFFLG